MPNYTIHYLEAGMTRVESASCDDDDAAVNHAKSYLRDPDGIVEVWRSDLVYHGTSTTPIGKQQPATATIGT
jgi:hypothetical protein